MKILWTHTRDSIDSNNSFLHSLPRGIVQNGSKKTPPPPPPPFPHPPRPLFPNKPFKDGKKLEEHAFKIRDHMITKYEIKKEQFLVLFTKMNKYCTNSDHCLIFWLILGKNHIFGPL